ncbi:MAG: VOC family protein [Gammaproteobacteria bacterium]|nr:VOC family protein [Gammaproteobacteria bacterium]
MHHSRQCSIIIDCDTQNLDAAASFWSEALGRPVNLLKSGDLEKYRTLDTPPGQIKCEVQKVEHPSRAHIDIETDNIEAEVQRLIKLGAREVERVRRWVVMEAPTGQRFCIVPPQLPDFPKGANRWS